MLLDPAGHAAGPGAVDCAHPVGGTVGEQARRVDIGKRGNLGRERAHVVVVEDEQPARVRDAVAAGQGDALRVVETCVVE